MTSKHTPGPWRIGSAARDYVASDAFGVVGNLICEAPPFTSSFENWEANARLIAAAPELLAALKAIVRESDRLSESEFHQAVAAIAAAEGGDQ